MSDNEYVSRPDQEGGVPVQSDDAPVKDNLGADRDSDAALARDDKEAINTDNIIEGRTREAMPKGGYEEPGDAEGLPENDGTSAIAQDNTKT